MTTAPDSGASHTLGWFASVDELLAMCVPFCDAGVRAGQPVAIVLSPPHAEALQGALADPARVQFMAHHEQYRHPSAALQGLDELLRCHGGRGDPASPVRMLGEPPPHDGLVQDGWLRYEAAINDALDGSAVDILCVHHRQAIGSDARAELRRTHPMIVGSDGTPQPSAEYQEPATFAATRRRVIRDPLEDRPPATVVREVTAAGARRAVEALAAGAGLASPPADDLVTAVNEVVTNAATHGRSPVTLQGWLVPGRVVIAVHDAGNGPTDPSLGLRPRAQTTDESGMGLWLTHQLCPEIAMSRSQDGFTVRLAANSHHATGAAIA